MTMVSFLCCRGVRSSRTAVAHWPRHRTTAAFLWQPWQPQQQQQQQPPRRSFATATDPGGGALDIELRAREREVLAWVKPELKQGYQWLQKLERKEDLERAPRRRKQPKKKQKKRKGNKKNNNNNNKFWDWPTFDNYKTEGGFFDADGEYVTLPISHALIGAVKSSLKLSAHDVNGLEVIRQPNPYKPTYRALEWVCLNDAAEIASKKYGGAAGFLDRLARMAGTKNKRAQGKHRQKSLERLSSGGKNQIAIAKALLRTKHRLPLYTNDPDSLRYLDALPNDALDERAIQTCSRRHFLMTFTQFPIIRNERSSLLMWISRYQDGVENALAFEALPSFMHDEVTRLWNEFFGRGTDAGDNSVPEPSTALETADHQYTTERLVEIDRGSRERAQRFIDLGLPNRAEASLVDDVINNASLSLRDLFPFLFRVEWVPTTGVGQGDLVFANRDGTKFAVVEAKANTVGQGHKITHVKKQTEFYSSALRREFRRTSHKVYAGYVTDDGLNWLSDVPVADEEAETTKLCDEQNQGDALQVNETEAMVIDAKSEKDKPVELSFASRRIQLETMTVRGGLQELLVSYGLVKGGRKAEMVDRILNHEGLLPNNSDSSSNKNEISLCTVGPSRREQLEAMNIQHELKALCYLYDIKPARALKREYVEVVWSYESNTTGLSAGY